jgi:type III secretion protein V
LAAGGKLLQALPGLAPTFLIVALLACVLVPLPTVLVDLLLSLSLAGAVLLLVASLGIRRTTQFLDFPSLLLLVTLYRLALNVSTTRLILSQADAGRVIDAFATFVVRSDLVVGGVMFAIITIVQYVVIARGAERVAEVAARFALDGLPGHQAAIDADLRAGVITPREASLRRAELGERSSFYGAMDGAIRFVKGDAIAGLAITAVNLLGGLAVGIGRDGLPWRESLDVYGRLTIGDGLLAQIPALLVSLAAGVLVSRVDRRERGAQESPIAWLNPAMLIVPAVLLVVLAAVPQMPHLAFLTTAAGLLLASMLLAVRSASRARVRPAVPDRRVTVHMASSDVEDRSSLERTLAEVRLQCSTALGIDVPPIALVTEPGRSAGELEVRIDDRRCGRSPVEAGTAGEDAVVLTTFRAVMDVAPDLVDLQDLDRHLDEVRETHPVVAQQALANVELSDVLAVVRGFLRERIRLPPMRTILGALAESHRFRDRGERQHYPELVRLRVAEHWVFTQLDSLHRLGKPRWVRLTADAEEELLEHFTFASDGPTLGLSARDSAAWLAAIREAAGAASAEPDPPSTLESTVHRLPPRPIIVVASPQARPAAALLVSGAIPRIPVFSTAELRLAREDYDPAWLSPP